MNTVANIQSQQSIGLLNLEAFELSQRIANMLCNSSLVPEQYRKTVKVKGQIQQDGSTRYKDNKGNWLFREEPNPNGLANCVIALNMASRLNADPLMVMQNLYLIEGRPAWSSQFIMAAINSCGRFSALRFEIQDLGEKEVEYTETEWTDGNKKVLKKKIKVQDLSCVAFAIERETNERIESSKITIEMAIKEGWYTKNGSKWQTMPEQMLRYRAASFFGRVYAPELLMGLRSSEEEQENSVIDVTPQTQVTQDIISNINVSEVKRKILAAKQIDELDDLQDEIQADGEHEGLIKILNAQRTKLLKQEEDNALAEAEQVQKTETKPDPKLETVKAKPTKKDNQKPVIEEQADVSDPASDLYTAINDAKNLDELKLVSKQIMTAERNKTINADQGQQIKQHYAQRKEVLAQADIFEDGQGSHLFVDKVVARILSAKNQDEINAEYANPAIEELSDQDRQRIDLAAGQRESELFG